MIFFNSKYLNQQHGRVTYTGSLSSIVTSNITSLGLPIVSCAIKRNFFFLSALNFITISSFVLTSISIKSRFNQFQKLQLSPKGPNVRTADKPVLVNVTWAHTIFRFFETFCEDVSRYKLRGKKKSYFSDLWIKSYGCLKFWGEVWVGRACARAN
jgi:hypothetical protein